jgi:hypothetical protein
MKGDIQVLQDALTHQISGILWITEEKLVDRPRPFTQLDYFLDGLLTNYYHHNSESEASSEKNFFITQHFGAPFFIGHLEATSNYLTQNSEDILKIVKPDHSKEVLVLDMAGKNITDGLKKRFKNLNFSELSL